MKFGTRIVCGMVACLSVFAFGLGIARAADNTGVPPGSNSDKKFSCPAACPGPRDTEKLCCEGTVGQQVCVRSLN